MELSEIIAILGPAALFAFAGAAICALAGGVMLDRVDRGGTGALLGFFLGPIGLVIAWVIRDNALRDKEAARARHHGHLDKAEAMLIGSRRTGLGPARQAADVPAIRNADIDALERLAKLREAGHLTDDEFAAKKRQILGGAVSRTSAVQLPQPRRFR